MRLYLDYGDEDLFGKPFADSLTFSPLPASTLSNPEPRIARANLPVNYWTSRPGCHTITMMVTHSFNETTGCPTRLSDSSQLTWYVYACEAGFSCLSNDPQSVDSIADCLDELRENDAVCPESGELDSEAVQ